MKQVFVMNAPPKNNCKKHVFEMIMNKSLKVHFYTYLQLPVASRTEQPARALLMPYLHYYFPHESKQQDIRI